MRFSFTKYFSLEGRETKCQTVKVLIDDNLESVFLKWCGHKKRNRVGYIRSVLHIVQNQISFSLYLTRKK